MDGERRRSDILGAALECFLESGITRASISDIREKSGASVGSIYHFFPSKEAIAAALYLDGLRGWTGATLPATVDTSPQATIAQIVSQAIEWGTQNSDLMRFMDENRFLLLRLGGLEEATAILGAAREEGERLLARLVKTGRMRAQSWEVAQPILLGPVQGWLQLHRHGQTVLDKEAARTTLIAAATRALVLEDAG
ncbi:TetR/AcrR family transcriptional regulator [Sphingomonas sp.]|uniref:TetR/AcrR family transcriptional regulator n=1 Tax=Sphingomonas sp. TaxID=28214 RepID=UPI002DEC00C0|nr:TetR/AcrR family transcriptional regulator [Sphingomonas sp.]